MQTVQLFGGTAGGAQRAAGTAQQSARQLHTLQMHTLRFMLQCYMELNGWSSAVQLRTHTCCGTKQSQNTF